jgi:hypothetical protein
MKVHPLLAAPQATRARMRKGKEASKPASFLAFLLVAISY